MKSKVNFKCLLILTTFLIVCSCRKDDCPVIEEPEKEENPENPDGIGLNENTSKLFKYPEA